MAPLDRAEVFAPGIVSTVNTEIMYGSLNGGRRRGYGYSQSAPKKHTGWAEPIPLAINSDRFDRWPSVTADGTLYFFSGRDGRLGGYDIYRSEKRNGVYSSVENLGPTINTKADELDPLLD